MPTATDLVTDLPADFEVFGQAVDTDFQNLLGGTTGQVLAKASGTDLDFTWVASASGDVTGVTAGTGITVTDPTGPVPTVSINTAVTADLTTAQTLTNKTLTSPALTTPTISTATTNGDILYGTGSGALQRLGIGSTAQVLTVTAGVPSWATAASGGMTSIASGSLSGSSLDLTSISGSYNSLQLVLRNFYFDNAANCRITINNTGSIYTLSDLNAVSSSAMTTADIAITSGAVRENVSNVNAAVLDFPDYKNAVAYKIITSKVISQNNTTPANHNLYNTNIWAASSAAITRITLYPSFGNFSGGTYILYGVK